MNPRDFELTPSEKQLLCFMLRMGNQQVREWYAAQPIHIQDLAMRAVEKNMLLTLLSDPENFEPDPEIAAAAEAGREANNENGHWTSRPRTDADMLAAKTQSIIDVKIEDTREAEFVLKTFTLKG
jgi:LPS sulfotransferase NodH